MLVQTKSNRYPKRWPFGVYVTFFVALIIGGIADSTYLAYSHYRVNTDIFYSSFCAVNQSLNCDTVSQSPYAVFLNVPVPLWGVLGYLMLIVLMPLALSQNAKQERLWALYILISASFCGISLWLAYISSVKIRSYCLMCIVSYTINMLLLFTGHVIRTRYGQGPYWRNLKRDFEYLARYRRKLLVLFCPPVLFTALIVVAMPHYWVPIPLTMPENVDRGVTELDHPWIGAQNPVLEITEFSDYQCFQCWKMHQFLRKLVAEYPDKIRLVHVHYPMDHSVNPVVREPFHEGAGLMAKMAIYAMGKGKFWEMNDYLFYHWGKYGKVQSHQAARDIGLDAKEMWAAIHSPYITERLQKLNIRRGMKLRVLGTPSFVIKGQLYQGTFPFQLLDDLQKNFAADHGRKQIIPESPSK
jgi:uncharacterized membrane protein/protein-disulfide isomerase